MDGLRFVRMVPSAVAPLARGCQHVPGAPAHVCKGLGLRAAGASAVETVQATEPVVGRRDENRALNILKVRPLWAERREEEEEEMGDLCVGCVVEEEDGSCDVDEVKEKAKRLEFDRDSFSKLLTRVSQKDAQVFEKMSYLGSLAYDIAKIKSENLLGCRGLRFITSSLDKRAKSLNAEKEKNSSQDVEPDVDNNRFKEDEDHKGNDYEIRSGDFYQVTASAVSSLFEQIKGFIPAGSPDNGNDSPEAPSLEVASFVATASSVTAVVAGKEEMRQAVAENLNKPQSSPCEWFVCDDDTSDTRYFVIQGSESLSSWVTNLLFEPIQFEGLDVHVHRGIYEAAKGIYEQMLPEVRAHLKSRGKSATFRFTGHSLGGSLSLLINLMLLIRGEVPASSLLPVITFGAPCIMCGGDNLLRKLGLPQTHVQAITMHRDIVPRAFSCHYPDHVAQFLKAVNANFRNHPCLDNQKLLYAPMGKLLILQPEDDFSPHHHLLPEGSGLYLLGHASSDNDDSDRLLQAAQLAFLNSPHPLEILIDLGAYGSQGTVYRDHDVISYWECMNSLTRREQRHNVWWPLVVFPSRQPDVMPGRVAAKLNNLNQQHHSNFFSLLHGGHNVLKCFGGLVASQSPHLFAVLLLPAKMLLAVLPVINHLV
ncbi:putative fungal lipase-like domain, alpha/Beta hydrolase, phospholipase A1 PLIP1/2/3 [Dioscorea sansibarensis]